MSTTWLVQYDEPSLPVIRAAFDTEADAETYAAALRAEGKRRVVVVALEVIA